MVIDKFRGKAGDDIDRFLGTIQRQMDGNVQNGKYNSDAEQYADHVALINRHCGSKVREFIRSLKGTWEEEPTGAQDGLIRRYRSLGDDGVDTGKDKILSLHQKGGESFEHYIQRAQKLTIACDGREDMHDELTSRFCRGVRERGHRNSLASMTDIWTQTGRARFEVCMANARRIARSDVSYKDCLQLTDSDSDADSSSDSSSPSDSDEDARKDRKKKKKEKRKRREYKEKRRQEKARAAEKKNEDPWDTHRGDKLDEKLNEIQRLKEDLLDKKPDELRELASQAKVSPPTVQVPTCGRYI